MPTELVNRRMLIAGAAAAAVATSALPMRRSFGASLPPINLSALTAGTWFDQVKAQHAAIEGTLTDIIAANDVGPARGAMLKQLSYLLTAHSVAEENVLYPKLVFVGYPVDSSDLYLEQQFQKVGNAEIDAKALQGETGAEFIDKVTALQAIILEHAKAHEEDDYYPKLQAKLDSAQNETLSQQFRANFLMIKTP